MESLEKQPHTPWFFPRPLPPAAAGFGLGVALSACLVPARYLPAACLLLAAAWLARRAGRRLVLLFFLCAALGLARAHFAYVPPLTESAGNISGRVCETPVRTGNTYTLTLDRLTVDGVSRRGRVSVTLSALAPPVYGQEVAFRALSVRPAERLSDRYRKLAGYASADADSVVWGVPQAGLYGKLLLLREKAAARLTTLFPSPEGLAAGILLGDKEGLTEDTAGAFRASGLAHLLAVSGLHVSILAAAVYAPLRFGPRWLRVALLAGMLLFYAALTAFSPSVLRASCMSLIGAAAFPLERRRDPASSLAAAFLFVLALNPNALFSASFQLSFAAVFGILTLSRPLRRPFRLLGRYASGLVAASAAASVATFPLLAVYYGEAPLFALAANFFVLPLLPLFAVPGMLALLGSCVSGSLGSAIAVLPRFVLHLIDAVVSRCPEALFPVPAPTVGQMLFFFAALLFFSRYCRRPRRVRATAAGVCLVFALLAAAF